MLKKSKVLLDLKKKINKLLSDEVVDIVVFGSVVKDKLQPRDVDVVVIFRKSVDADMIRKFQDALGEHYHLSTLSIDNFLTKPHSLARTILFEGRSIITDAKLSENLGLRSFTLYSYKLSGEKQSKKVRFVYLLKGRAKSKGIVQQLHGEYIAPGTFIIPVEYDERMLEILKVWGAKFHRKKIFLMS